MDKLIIINAETLEGKDHISSIYNIYRNEKLTFVLYLVGEFKYNINLRFNLVEEYAKAEIYIIEKGNKNHDVNLDLTNIHSAKNTYGRVFIRRVMNDYSSSSIDGKLIIENGASASSDFFDEKTLLLGDKVVSKVIPSLEIIPSDVLVSHSSSISSVSEDEIFYLRSRGVPMNESFNLIENGFLISNLLNITKKSYREKIKNTIPSLFSFEN
ncbi:SufD family Fe-S cluster assembly protein [Patescibacteria group bacterium]|nr:SufD family Fe-S cluster assembly protein [Patescibacteria group bacterium]